LASIFPCICFLFNQFMCLSL